MASRIDLARLVTAPKAMAWCTGCLAVLMAMGCAKKERPEALIQADERSRSVYTVNYPLAYFAKRLVPEGVAVIFPAPPDVDPAYWKPTPAEIGKYQDAGLILLNGAGYARWARYATLPSSRTRVTTDGCREQLLPAGQAVTHQHGPGGEHAHEGVAFTTWLDMRLAACQAGHVRDSLVELDSSAKAGIDAKLAELERDLSKVHSSLQNAAKAWGEKPMLASHPVYQYLADAYGLRIESLHFEPDEAPSPEAIDGLDALLTRHRAKLMLWEAQPLAQTERLLADRGIVSVVFDPAAQPPPDGDFVSVMRANAERLACATGAKSCP